jgi:membrane protein DedA with SNARE-associated domain/rhodanese-related sulfurtransferase
MPSFHSLLLKHGYAFLFCYVFSVQAGVPIPADPLLLLMGALVGDGRYSLLSSAVAASMAALAGDTFWYELGRRRGRPVLALLCRLSIEPDTCVRNTETGFARRGAWTLLFAKFIPGMSLLSMPLAGASGMPRVRFLLIDAIGCALWSLCYLLLGKLFHRQIDALSELLGLFGRRAGIVVSALLGAYILWKFFQRWRLRRELRINRLSPLEAFGLIESGQPVTVVDLRNATEIQELGLKIRGALIVHPNDLRSGSHLIPMEDDIILYCTCPNEATSARAALQLKRAGIRKVHPLAGGFVAWHDLGLPVEAAILPRREAHDRVVSSAP